MSKKLSILIAQDQPKALVTLIIIRDLILDIINDNDNGNCRYNLVFSELGVEWISTRRFGF